MAVVVPELVTVCTTGLFHVSSPVLEWTAASGLVLIFHGYIGIGERDGQEIRQMRVLLILCARRQIDQGDRPLIGGDELCHGDALSFIGGVTLYRNLAGFRAGFLIGGGLQQFNCPIMERSAAIIGNGMHQTCRGKPDVAILECNLRRLRALLRIRDLRVAQCKAEIIMAVVVHQSRLAGIDRDGKDANKHVLQHKVMAGFRSDFHGRLGLLGPGGQGKNGEQSHDRKFSHREAILDAGRMNANKNMQAKIER